MAYLTTTVVTVNLCGIYSDVKLSMLKNFLNYYKHDFVFLQEVAVESFNFYGYKEIVNLNRERRGTAVLFKESIPVKSVCQLSDGRGVAVQFRDVVLINIYAPSGSQNRQQKRLFCGRHDAFIPGSSKQVNTWGGLQLCSRSAG